MSSGVFSSCLQFIQDIYSSWFVPQDSDNITFFGYLIRFFSLRIRDLLPVDLGSFFPDAILPDFVVSILNYTLFGLMFNVGLGLFLIVTVIKWVTDLIN